MARRGEQREGKGGNGCWVLFNFYLFKRVQALFLFRFFSTKKASNILEEGNINRFGIRQHKSSWRSGLLNLEKLLIVGIKRRVAMLELWTIPENFCLIVIRTGNYS